jgi:hypothetical protein
MGESKPLEEGKRNKSVTRRYNIFSEENIPMFWILHGEYKTLGPQIWRITLNVIFLSSTIRCTKKRILANVNLRKCDIEYIFNIFGPNPSVEKLDLST